MKATELVQVEHSQENPRLTRSGVVRSIGALVLAWLRVPAATLLSLPAYASSHRPSGGAYAAERASVLARIAVAHHRKGEAPLALAAFARAEKLVEDTVRKGQTVTELVDMARAYHDVGQSPAAKRVLLDALVAARKAPEPSLRAVDIGFIAMRAAQLGNGDVASSAAGEAVAAVAEVSEPYMTTQVWKSVLGVHAYAGREDEMRVLLGGISDAKVYTQVCIYVGGDCAQAGKKALALELLSKAEASLGRIEQPRERVLLWVSLAQRLGAIGEQDRAERALKAAERDPGTREARGNRLSISLVAAYVYVGKSREARRMIAELPGAVKVHALMSMAEAYAERGERETSSSTLAEACLMAQELVQGEYVTSVATAMQCMTVLYVKIGMVDEALKVAMLIPGKSRTKASHRATALQAVGCGLADAGRIDEASEIVLRLASEEE